MKGGMFATNGSNDLKTLIGATALRQKFIANNIANLQTPDYVAKDFNFMEFVKKSSSGANLGLLKMKNTNIKHYTQGKKNNNSAFHLDGLFIKNFVNFKKPSEEEEMVALATNALAYKSAADLLAREYRIMSTAITGGR